MNKILAASLGVGAMLATACGEGTTATSASDLAVSMSSVYSATPAGFSELTSSFNATGGEGAFAPTFDRDDHGHGPGGMGGMGGMNGMGGPGFGLGLMGGGLGGMFFGDGMHRPGPNSARNCVFTAGTGVVCTDTTRDGLIARKIIKYTNAAGVLQSAYDSATTASVSSSSTVSGTATRRDSSTSVVSHTSTQTITGLLTANRSVNGTASGTETTTGRTRDGVAFNAKRTTSDAVTGVVIPKATTANSHPYPTAGKIVRSMSATVTLGGGSPATTTRTETITYDGTATAKVVIVKDGVTQNCTLPLPHGRLSCS